MAWLVVVLLVSWLSGVGSAPDLPSLEDDTTCTTPENHKTNGILTKRLLENQRVRKTRNREPEVVSLQNDARKRYLKSQLLIKRTSSRIQLSYHEESRRLIEGSLEVKLPTIWRDEKQSRAGKRQREEKD